MLRPVIRFYRERRGGIAIATTRAGLPRAALGGILLLLFVLPSGAWAQWAASAGDTVRNGFGPAKLQQSSVCRGACGASCPSSCDAEIQYECINPRELARVQIYECGTHQGCREHDDCLDRCAEERAKGFDCAAYCHTEAIESYGIESALAWAAGGGPMDSARIRFEYTMNKARGAEAIYRCPERAQQQCSSGSGNGYCQLDGVPVDPVFHGFRGGDANRMQVSNFRSGRVCDSGGQPSSVCEVTMDIPITGEQACSPGSGEDACSWYGFALTYSNATPGEPLFCSSTGSDKDFLGGFMERALQSRSPSSETEDGALPKELGSILNNVQRDLQRGKSLEGALSGISITTADGQTIGGYGDASALANGGIPNEIAVPSTSGTLFVPAFEAFDVASAGSTVEHQVTCLHRGEPVLETTFRLQFAQADGSVLDSSDGVSEGGCSCACNARDDADELCAFFCEEEFAACR